MGAVTIGALSGRNRGPRRISAFKPAEKLGPSGFYTARAM